MCKIENERLTDEYYVKLKDRKEAKRSRRVRNPAVITESDGGEMNMEGCSVMNEENVCNIMPDCDSANFGTPVSNSLKDDGEIENLKSFLSRPITIFDEQYLANATSFSEVIRPWDIWISDPTIRSKLTNYAYFRGELEITVSFSSSTYQYGHVLLSYQPYDLMNDTMIAYTDLMTATTPTEAEVRHIFNAYLSSGPSTTIIDLNNPAPLKFTVPFILNKEYARLYTDDTGVITNLTQLPDFYEMGALYMNTVSQGGIMSAQADVSANISVNMSARMTNIQVATNTSTNVNITAEGDMEEVSIDYRQRNGVQSNMQMHTTTEGDSRDESSDPGPISTIASAVDSIAGVVSKVPIIGPFATATGQIARKIGSVAALFGFSKPPILDKPTMTVPEKWSNGAQLAGGFSGVKLSCDPKQELSISMDFGGTGSDDQMALSTICSRPSMIGYGHSDYADIALDTVLFTAAVTPSCNTTLGLPAAKTLMQPSNLTFASAPFRYWRGSITYRIDFICSKFHRGKYIITYEPNIEQSPLLLAADLTLNQQNHIIVDLAESQSVEFTVGWSTDRAFKVVNPIDTIYDKRTMDVVNATSTTYDLADTPHEMCNGYWEMRLLNELVVPNGNLLSDAVFFTVTQFSNDIEFSVPNDDCLTQDRQYTETESDSVLVTLNDPLPSQNVFLTHFGERITSFRSLLKRYHTSAIYSSNTTNHIHARTKSISHQIYPTMQSIPSYTGTLGSNVDASSFPDLFNYLRWAYLGMRGGYRYRMTVWDENGSSCNHAQVSLLSSDNLYYQPAIDSKAISAAIPYIHKTLDGTVSCKRGDDMTMEFEVPYYSRNKFEVAFHYSAGSGHPESFYAYDKTNFEYVWKETPRMDSGSTDVYSLCEVSSASAEDFTFIRYNGPPFYTITTV